MTDSDPTTPKFAAIAEDIALQELIARYLSGPALVRDAIAGMDDAQLNARPIEGKMSTYEVVTHIVDSDAGLGGRITRAMAGEEVPVMQGRGGHPEHVAEPGRDLDADLTRLEAQRAVMAEALGQAGPGVWELVAMRREERVMTVRQLLIMMTRHLENHVAAIDEKRAALGL